MGLGPDTWKFLTAPRVGRLSALGLAACVLLAVAAARFADGAMPAIVFVSQCLFAVVALFYDFKRNA